MTPVVSSSVMHSSDPAAGNKSMVRIRLVRCFGGFEEPREFDLGQIVVGKPRDGHLPDLDLTPDARVSRRHLRIFADGNQAFVEDSNSTYGTKLNDAEIKGTGI